MCGICGMLWILLQLEQQIQLAFRMLLHIDHSNGSCNKTATPIPIDIVYVHVPPLLYYTKLNSGFKSDLSDVLVYWRNLDPPKCYQCIMLLTKLLWQSTSFLVPEFETRCHGSVFMEVSFTSQSASYCETTLTGIS